MRSERLKIRRKPDFRSFFEEMKFLKSFRDLACFFHKVLFLLPRLTHRVDRWAMVPPSVQIEPTLRCNFNCITCCRSQSRREAGDMDFALFRRIIDDASRIGTRRIQLFVFGEPLMHPQIVEMIQYVKSKRIAFHLSTNGQLMDDETGDSILRSGVTSEDYITFSVLGFSREVHEKVMKGADHQRVVNNIRGFMRNRKLLGVNGPVVETVFYSVSENEHELEAFLRYWSGIVDHAIDGGKAVEAFINQGMPTRPRTRMCSLLWERMTVLWNGDVVICGEDVNGEYIVGNLREQSIRDVWLGKELTEIKKIHKRHQFQKIPICRFCDW